jgi:hypothetical protein
MYQKFWNQFITEAAEPTFDFGDEEPTKPDPQPARRSLTGLGLFLKEKGYYLDKVLGSGKDGIVYQATNIKTGQKVAVKTIAIDQGEGADAEREVKNYKFVKDNYDSLGENKKYLPVVYEASMEDIPVQGEGMDGITMRKGFIIMEQLEPLPSEVARAMFVIGGGSKTNKEARIKRDRRLLKNPALVTSMLGMAWGLVNPKTTEKLLTFEAVEAAEPKILELFFTTNTEPMNNSYIRRMAMSDKGKELMTLYVNITYQEMLNHLPPEEKKGKIEDYETKIKQLIEDSEKTIKEDLIESFYQAYARPLVTGAAGITPPPKSGLRGFDFTWFGEEEAEEDFPEIIGVRAAMKEFAGRDFKPYDVHAGNVMMRPGTNDIVIVDLGRFNI